MSDEHIRNYALFFQIKSCARNYKLSRARYLEDEQRLVLALHNYGAIPEEEMETIGEKQSELQGIIHAAVDDAVRINRDASGSHED